MEVGGRSGQGPLLKPRYNKLEVLLLAVGPLRALFSQRIHRSIFVEAWETVLISWPGRKMKLRTAADRAAPLWDPQRFSWQAAAHINPSSMMIFAKAGPSRSYRPFVLIVVAV
jgi:hypothetical protein